MAINLDRKNDQNRSDKNSIKTRTGLAASLAAAIILALGSAAQAHVSISPVISVSTSGTVTRDAVSIGKSGYLFFRLGHGCTYGTTTDVNPLTGLSLEGSSWGTHAFSVTIPYAAAISTTANVSGNNPTWTYGVLKAPKPGYRPGWTSKVVLNQGEVPDTALPTDQTSYAAYLASVKDDSYTITWTANSSEFDVPAYAQDDDGNNIQTVFAEFEVSVSWAKSDQTVKQSDGTGNTADGNLTNASTQYFNAGQTCIARLSKKPASPSAAKVKVKALSGGRVQIKINAASSQRGKVISLAADGVAVTTDRSIKLNAHGDATAIASGSGASLILSRGALVSATNNGSLIGYKIGSLTFKKTLNIHWDQQLASGAAAVESDNGRTESNQAPSVKVFTAQ